MDERDRGQGSLSDKVKGSYRRVSVVMYVTLVIAAIAVFAAAYVPKQFSLAYTILVLIVFLVFFAFFNFSFSISYYGSQ